MLKLVGQAKEKNKNALFFDCLFSEGRYFLFAQAEAGGARVSFFGEGRPSIKVVEEIHSTGLKNDFAEYLPMRVDRKDKEGK